MEYVKLELRIFRTYAFFSDHRVLRTATKRRMFRNIGTKGNKKEVVQSYLGLLKYGNAWRLMERIEMGAGFREVWR